MSKSLSEMTLEELWKLFPIILSEHKNCWGDWYEEEKKNITSLLHDKDLRINHVEKYTRCAKKEYGNRYSTISPLIEGLNSMKNRRLED